MVPVLRYETWSDGAAAMNEHYLKTWPEYFDAVIDGRKPFEFRKNDRGFEVGDILILQEWDPLFRNYTGKSCVRRVTYLLRNLFMWDSEEYVVMGISEVISE